MAVSLVQSPLARHILTGLRRAQTPSPQFRALARRLALLLVLEATRDLPTRRVRLSTPLEETTGEELDARLVAVPVLRAALGLLEAVVDLYPDTAVGYIGVERDEATFLPHTYYSKIPPAAGAHVLLLDPMLATGGTACTALAEVKAQRPASVRFVGVVGAPVGIARVEDEHPDVPIVLAAVDRELDDRAYILPGIGDFGDRLFGSDDPGAQPR